MILPIKTDSPLRAIPWVNWLLISANVLMFIAQRQLPASTFENLILSGGNPQLHQFVTYAFLHANVWHLLGNMLFLYIFGNNINDKLGNFGYLCFYLAGAIFAGVGYVAFNDTSVLGASGGVSAVTGAYLALMPRSRITVLFWFLIIGVYEIPSVWFIIAYFALDVYQNFASAGSVAHLAHISGSVYGFFLCLGLLWTRLLPRDHFDMLGILDRWRRRQNYQSVVNQGYNPFGISPKVAADPRRNSPPAFPPLFDKTQELRAQISEALAHGKPNDAANLYLQLHQLDPTQILSRGSQLDIATHLFGRHDYQNAADAWELFLKNYRASDQTPQVSLMLGLTYARYLNQPDNAKPHLLDAVRLLKTSKELDLAKSALLLLENPAI